MDINSFICRQALCLVEVRELMASRLTTAELVDVLNDEHQTEEAKEVARELLEARHP